MPRKWQPTNDPDLIRLYQSGLTEVDLAAHFGVCRLTVSKRLTANGIPKRSWSDTQRINASRHSPEERKQQAEAAHAAVRGKKRSFDELCLRARTRQSQGRMSPAEILLADWLWKRGIDCIPQEAIGPYNADLGAAPVSVEVNVGNFHATGRHRDRCATRSRYILDQGWNLVIVWISERRHPLTPKVADYLAAFIEEARSDPTLRGQYRVVWGDGEEVPHEGLKIDDLARVPPRR